MFQPESVSLVPHITVGIQVHTIFGHFFIKKAPSLQSPGSSTYTYPELWISSQDTFGSVARFMVHVHDICIFSSKGKRAGRLERIVCFLSKS